MRRQPRLLWTFVALLSTAIASADAGDGTWSPIGVGLAGSHGIPVLDGEGSLAPRTENRIELSQAQPSSLAVVFTSLSRSPVPFFGGELFAFPLAAEPVVLPTDATGRASIRFSLPVGIRPGTHFYIQAAVADPSAKLGVALSNGLLALTP